jgi:hypothetical protein
LNPTPSRPPENRRRRDAALRALTVGAVLVAFALARPPDHPAWRFCGFYLLTHRDCPFCGLTRALCAAMKGEWLHALRLHALSPLVLGWLVGLFVFSIAAAFGRQVRLPSRLKPIAGWSALALFLLYWPLRLLKVVI